jgi:hypothetical protein
MSSVYHILDKIPATEADEMQVEYENLAQELVQSGRLRIDTDYYCNFTHFSDPNVGISLMLTTEELTDPKLITFTKQNIKNLYLRKNKKLSDDKLSEIIAKLGKQTIKLMPVDHGTKMRLARVLVQAAHPIVIRWLLLDRTQIFITYSHNIGDVMDISSWKISGTNSGMQSTDGSNVCIYVSCGGDPFAKNNEQNPIYGDGWASLARLQIIAGQEIGHYADIMRNPQGSQIGRHSANFSCTRAAPHVKKARRDDVIRCKNLYQKLLLGGMKKLLDLEEQLKFYDVQKVSGLRVLWIRGLIKYHKHKFFRFAHDNHHIFVKKFRDEKYVAIMIKTMIADMQFNLSPVADVYKREDPEAEEAIACVEALARVPQQVMKWGYITTRATMHDLYKVYYGEVIPSLTQNYELYTGRQYKRSFVIPKLSTIDKILKRFGLGKYKNRVKFVEVRNV